MKFIKLFFLELIVLITLFGCVDSGKILKPANLISENQMEQILYDATLMEVMSTFSKKNSAFEAISGKTYLYKKYSLSTRHSARQNCPIKCYIGCKVWEM